MVNMATVRLTVTLTTILATMVFNTLDHSSEDLAAAIRAAAAGKTPVDPKVAGKLFAQIARTAAVDTAPLAELGEREREVLALLAKGLSNTDIATTIHLSEGTVRNYVSTILSKLGVADRTQAAILAIRAGLLEDRADHKQGTENQT